MKKAILLILFFVGSISYSQSIKFEGFVTDSKAVALEMANIIAVNVSTKAMDSYAITNDKGKFALNLKPNTNYVIKFSYLGMQNKELSLMTSTENVTKTITMEE